MAAILQKRSRDLNPKYSQPTYVGMMADVVAKLIETDYYGIYHVSNSGSASR